MDTRELSLQKITTRLVRELCIFLQCLQIRTCSRKHLINTVINWTRMYIEALYDLVYV